MNFAVNTVLWFIAGFLIVHVSIFLHEVGHLIFCLLYKLPVGRMFVGSGPVVFRFKDCLVWGLWPTEGGVDFSADKWSGPASGAVLSIAGGPLTSYMLWVVCRSHANDVTVTGAVLSFASVLNGLLLVLSLTGTDGHLLKNIVGQIRRQLLQQVSDE